MGTDRLSELRIDRGDDDLDSSSRGVSRRWIVGIAIVALAVVAAFLVWRERRAPAVTVVAAERVAEGAAATSVLDGSGYVTARRRATVSSKVTGKVEEVLLEEGMEVEEGQVLARLDDSIQTGQLALAGAQAESAEASMTETRAQLREADLSLQRARNLVEQEVTSQAELDAAIANRDALAARLQRQERDLRAAREAVALRRQELEDTIIRAPFAGVVVTKDAQPGEMISPVSAGGGFTRTGIGTVVDMESLEIEVDVNEAYIQRVYSGQPVSAVLDAYPDWSIPARVITLVPTADRQKATVRVRIGFLELDPRILPDMGVKVSFEAEASEEEGASARAMVSVPAGAVVTRDGMDVVFLAIDGRADRRAVTVAERRGAAARITAGLSGGERVVVDPPDELTDRHRIRVEEP